MPTVEHRGAKGRTPGRGGAARPRPDGPSIRVVDLSTGGVRTLSGIAGAERTSLLVRRGIRALAYLEGRPREAAARLAAIAEDASLGERGWKTIPVGANAGGEGASASFAPTATVIVCTTGASDMLRDAVKAILDQDLLFPELIVVDNAPSSGRARAALDGIRDPRLRIVEAPAKGLSRARNAGVLAASGEILAFTDDDAIVDRSWLRALLEPFASDEEGLVGGVTGIVLPLELSHPAQRWFESRGGFPKDLAPRLWFLGDPPPGLARFGEAGEGGPLHPYTTARVGAGVCMAFRSAALRECGPFDPTLGAGAPARGGEDLDMFARILAASWAIVHTPDAVVHHRHRRDEEGLRLQIRGNGSGTSALLAKTITQDPRVLFSLVGRIPAVLARLRPGTARVSGAEPDTPGGLTGQEMIGFLEGPLAWARARLGARLDRSSWRAR